MQRQRQSTVGVFAAAVVLVALVVTLVGAEVPYEDELRFLREKVHETWPHMPHDKAEEFALVLFKLAQEESFIDLPPAHQEGQNETAIEFPCEVYGPSDPVPTSAKRLRPADIKVLGALGDSLTAGFGAKAGTIFTLFNDFRGVSYANGGDGPVDKVLTLGTILRKYNPDIKGLSTGKGDINSGGAHLNLAVTGAIVQDVPSQVNNFIKRVKATSGIDYDNDWKMVSILIGHNNLCSFCSDAGKHGPETFGRLLEESVDILYSQVPRLFVNLLSPVDVTALYPASQGLCSLLHAFECSCGVDKNAAVREAVSKAHAEYFEELKRVAGLDKYKAREDFAVVVQPFLEDTKIPTGSNGKPDTSYLAPDCFHFSEKAHQAAAVGLWNNIIEQDKQTVWVPGEPIECPANGAVLTT